MTQFLNKTGRMSRLPLCGLAIALVLCLPIALVLCLSISCQPDKYDSVNGWIYHDMTEYYLFYEDVPTKKYLNFNLSPEEFLKRAASERDQKDGYVFSHIERDGTKAAEKSFGFEAAILRDEKDRYYFRVLYRQENSPASEAGLERGDWIIQADGANLNANSYSSYIANPTAPCTFTRGTYNGRGFKAKDTLQMPAPRHVEEKNLLKHTILDVAGRKTAYLLYNGFEQDEAAFEEAFNEFYSAGVDHIILDLRYNPGGYVNTARALCAYLAPEAAVGKTLFSMAYNRKVNRTQTYTVDASMRHLPGALPYGNLYIIASGNTASAAELVINCLRPYMRNRLYQVGTDTYGKNVAQSAMTDKVAPGMTLWLTTCLIANCEGFSDYFYNGLPPDYYAKENFSGTLAEFASSGDVLCAPIFRHISNGDFKEDKKTGTGVPPVPVTTVGSGLSRKARTALLDEFHTTF